MLDDAPDYRARVEFLAPLVPPSGECLDLGCGDGAYVSRLAPLCQHIVGVDADADGIRLGRDKLARAGLTNTTLIHGPFHEAGETLAAAGRRFDLIYSMDVIEHLYDPNDLLDLAEKLLTPDGVVVIGTPLFALAETVSKYHIKEFLVEELDALLLPRFHRVREAWLDACFPSVPGWAPRFYTFVGRKRKAGDPVPAAEPAERRAVRQDMLVRLYQSLGREAELHARVNNLEERLAAALAAPPVEVAPAAAGPVGGELSPPAPSRGLLRRIARKLRGPRAAA